MESICYAFNDPDKSRRFLMDLLRDVCHAERIHQVDDGRPFYDLSARLRVLRGSNHQSGRCSCAKRITV